MALEEDYQHALQLINSDDSLGDNEAYNILCGLGNYKDATELLKGFIYRVISAEYSGSKIALNNGVGTFYYDDYGRLILETGPSWEHAYVYDEDGKLIKDGPRDFSTVYQYSSDGNLISTRKPEAKDSSGKTYYLSATYNESGYPLTVKSDYSALYWIYQYQGKGEALYDSVQITIRYRGLEYSIDLNDYDCDKLCEGAVLSFPTFWTINADGKQTSCYQLRLDAKNGIYRQAVENCEYDEQMNLVRKITYDRNGKQEYEFRYINTYDDANNLIKVERQTAGGTGKVVQEFKYGYIYAPNAELERNLHSPPPYRETRLWRFLP